MLNPDDVALTRALERGEVPAGGFPHASHLRVAWVYLAESPSLDDALARMSATLCRFTISVGHPEKFSEPMTAFWMLQVAAARAAMPGADLDAVLRYYPRLLDKNFIRGDADHDVPAPDSTKRASDASHRRAKT
jgi:hypothetical protein